MLDLGFMGFWAKCWVMDWMEWRIPLRLSWLLEHLWCLSNSCQKLNVTKYHNISVIWIVKYYRSWIQGPTIQGWAGIPVPGHYQEWMPLIPFPELWEWIFSFPFRSRIMGMVFFSFPSRSRIVEMIFHSLPVPKLWKWFFIHFPFPNLPFHGNQNGNWITVGDTRSPFFSASSTFLKTIILRR